MNYRADSCVVLSASRASRAARLVPVAMRAAAVVGGAVLTAAAAQVSVPLPWTPVPFSLQPMAVLLTGAVLGARLGASAQALYLIAGIAGLPVFAAVPGLPLGAARLLGPTGGFLLAFPLAAAVAGATAQRGAWTHAALGALVGMVTLYAGGVVALASLVPGGLGEAVALTLAVLGPADLIKAAAAAAMVPAVRVWVGPLTQGGQS